MFVGDRTTASTSLAGTAAVGGPKEPCVRQGVHMGSTRWAR